MSRETNDALDAVVRHHLKPIRKRGNWWWPWGGAAIAGVLGWWLWQAGQWGGLSALAAAALWTVAASCFFAGLPRWRFARDLAKVRRKAARPLPSVEVYRDELLREGMSPGVATMLAEQRAMRAEMVRGAARRRVMLLEAGVVVPDRWKDMEL